MQRSARVISTGLVSIPDSGQRALQIITDYRPECEAGLYLRPDSPVPEVGSNISYGDRRAWYSVDGRRIVARKLAYIFSPDAPLR